MAPSEFSKAQRTVYLVTRYINGSIDFAELQELEQWRKASEHNETQFQIMIDPEQQSRAIKRMQSYDSKAMLAKVREKIQQRTDQKEIRTLHWKRILVAAISLSLIGTLCYKYFPHKTINNKTAAITHPVYIPAGSNKATLTLSNGTKINLNDSQTGTIAQQSGATIEKKTGGLIAYASSQNSTDTATAYNLIETPRGGQYRLVLPDGTKVWLNAASTLKYPTRFTGKLREVTLTGEGYFEVIHNAKQPFIVKTSTQTIRDIGTSFNVNSYTDEPHSITTLVEGSIQLAAEKKKVILKPGQQATNLSGSIKVSDADIETATAWKNNQIAFHHADIQNVLRQIARWYNLKIEYQGKIPNIIISGGVSRQADLSAVLKMLQLSEVHFIQQDHKLIILNQDH